MLKDLKVEIETEDIIANGKLDKLIRKQRITSDMATSLMNDSAYAYEIQRNLIAAAEIIFVKLFATDLDLSEEELEKTMQEKRAGIFARLRKEEAQLDRIIGYDSRQDEQS